MKLIIILLFFIISFVNATSQNDELFSKGKHIYESTCISCHGVNGDSKTNMKLSVKPRILTHSILSENQIKKIVAEGAHTYGAFSDIMASYKYLLSDEKLNAVSKYIYKEFVKKSREEKLLLHTNRIITKEPSLKRGKKIFNRNCALCHGRDGSGNSEYVEMSNKNNNFIYPYDLRNIILDESQIFLFAKYGGDFWGTHGNIMPSWKKKYNDSDIESVSKYVYEKIKK